MREILFRGKQTGKDKWSYGVPVKGTNIDESEMLIIESVFKCDEYACRGCDFEPVIPSTIGQYTGMTDKNGKKIFEGDIVAIDHTIRTYRWDEIPETYKPRRSYAVAWNENLDELNYKRNYAVEWKENDARWILRNGSDQHNLKETFLYFHNGVIIGNIHDNPELLKGSVDDA